MSQNNSTTGNLDEERQMPEPEIHENGLEGENQESENLEPVDMENFNTFNARENEEVTPQNQPDANQSSGDVNRLKIGTIDQGLSPITSGVNTNPNITYNEPSHIAAPYLDAAEERKGEEGEGNEPTLPLAEQENDEEDEDDDYLNDSGKVEVGDDKDDSFFEKEGSGEEDEDYLKVSDPNDNEVKEEDAEVYGEFEMEESAPQVAEFDGGEPDVEEYEESESDVEEESQQEEDDQENEVSEDEEISDQEVKDNEEEPKEAEPEDNQNEEIHDEEGNEALPMETGRTVNTLNLGYKLNNSFEENFDEQPLDSEDRRDDMLKSFVDNHPMSESAILSIEKSDSFLSSKNSFIENSKELTRGLTRRYDDSALGLHPFYVHDLSQIMNPNLDQILQDDNILKNHLDTDRSKKLLKRFYRGLQLKVKRDNNFWKRFSLQKIMNFRTNKEGQFDKKRGQKRTRKLKRKCARKMKVLSGIYDKMHLMKAYTIWHEVLRSERAKENNGKRFAQVFGIMLKNKLNDFKREAYTTLVSNNKAIKETLAKERKQKEADERRKQMNNANFLQLYEKLRQIEIKNKNFGFNSIRFDAEDAYGGTRRNKKYRKKAATMHFGHMLERIFENQKKNALDKINNHNNFPGAIQIIKGDKKLKSMLIPKLRRRHGKEFFLRLKAWFNSRVKENNENLNNLLKKILHNRLNSGLRGIYAENLDKLKYEKKLMFFSGIVSKLVKDQKQRMLRDSFTDIYRLNRIKMIKTRNAKILVLKIKKLLLATKKDSFNRVRRIPEIAEKFYIANKRLERSMKLRAALKIGNYFCRYYDKTMNGRVRKVVSYLRRFNHQYKKPVYYQRLTSFVELWEKKRKEQLAKTFDMINNKGIVHLLRRFFNNTVNLEGGLNDEVVFALQNNVKTQNGNLNNLVEFWNTTYEINEPSRMSMDNPDIPPSLQLRKEFLVNSRKGFDTYGLLDGRKRGRKANQRPSGGEFAKSDHPYNRHSEISSCHKRLFMRNKISPAALGRASPAELINAIKKRTGKTTRPHSDLSELSKQDRNSLRKKFGIPHEYSDEKPQVEDYDEYSERDEFDRFDRGAEHGQRPFDSFSAKKEEEDPIDEAYRKTMILSQILDDQAKDKRGDDVEANIFKR